MSNDELFRGNPIEHSSEDLLDRSGISDSISKLICNDNLKECCTIGISGPWGCGKTSIINMVRENVEKYCNNVLGDVILFS
jgi:predicted KAP-like P-loop ATPase